ncbi:MAG TPA: nitroreductase/quinone reductase family protein [Anaerolineales bacterium]
MKANDFVTVALRSPLQALMGNTVLITVTGRKTGRRITLPVNYYTDGDALWILSSRDRTWWRNLLTCGEVEVRLHGRDLTGFGEVIFDEKTVAARIVQYVLHIPVSARSIGLRIENGKPDPEDLARLARERLFVKICVSAPS